MDYISNREIRKLEKKLDKKQKMQLDKSNSIVVGYQYHPPLQVLVPEERRVFNIIKENMYIENMINSYIFIFHKVRFEVAGSDWEAFKKAILDYLMSLNHPLEYAKCVLKIVEYSFSHTRNRTVNINDLIENMIIISNDGYDIEDLLKIKQELIEKTGHQIIDFEAYKQDRNK